MFEPGAYAVEDAVWSGRWRRHFELPGGMALDHQRGVLHEIWAALSSLEKAFAKFEEGKAR